MKTENKKSYFLSRLFKHLDGIAISPILITLEEEGVLSHILKNDNNSLIEIAHQYNANSAYLNVALRMLASQGYLDQEIHEQGGDIQFKSKL